jgi:hypothetical protein
MEKRNNTDPKIIQSKALIGLSRVDNLSFEDIRLKLEEYFMKKDSIQTLSAPKLVNINKDSLVEIGSINTKSTDITVIDVKLIATKSPIAANVMILSTPELVKIKADSTSPLKFIADEHKVYLQVSEEHQNTIFDVTIVRGSSFELNEEYPITDDSVLTDNAIVFTAE